MDQPAARDAELDTLQGVTFEHYLPGVNFHGHLTGTRRNPAPPASIAALGMSPAPGQERTGPS